jgi:phasin family protein
MFALPAQFVALQRQSLESTQAIALACFAGFEKLAQLNVQAAKASVEESVQRSTSFLEAKDVNSLVGTITASATGDKLTAYRKHVYEIATETGAEISKAFEKQFSEGKRQLTASVEAMAKNLPVGSEGVATLVKSAATAADATWSQVNQASHQLVEEAESNVGTPTSAARAVAKRK